MPEDKQAEQQEKEEEAVLFIKAPPKIRDRFKAACGIAGSTMRHVLVEFMRRFANIQFEKEYEKERDKEKS